MLAKIEGRRKERQRLKWLDDIIGSMEMILSKFWEIVKDREAWRATVYGVTKDQTIEQGQQKQEKGLDCYLRTMELPEMLCT